MADTIVPVGENQIKGDITECKIETAEVKVERKGALSLTERVTYRSYDVCTKKTINEYTNSEIAPGIGLILIPVLLIVMLFSFIGFGDSDYGW